jgi:hypothetical protein
MTLTSNPSSHWNVTWPSAAKSGRRFLIPPKAKSGDGIWCVPLCGQRELGVRCQILNVDQPLFQ